jgi:hypothetical protein
MKNAIRFTSVLFVVAAFFLTNCTGNQQPSANQEPSTSEMAKPTSEQLIERGDYLVTIMGCHDCHSPKIMGPVPKIIQEVMLSGFQAANPIPEVDVKLTSKGMTIMNSDLTAAAGPWGISFSANLSSDQTGIGSWTEENFKRALKEGKYKGLEGTRTLLPPMPWFNFGIILDEDVAAIFAYLKSTPPVKNAVPMPIPPDQLASM